jgi:predicted GNAT family N-acyltransferase
MDKLKFAQTKNFLETVPVREEVFIKEQKVPKELELDGLDEKSLHFVILDEESVIGCARVREINGKSFKFERVAVLPNYRGKGLGHQFMLFIEKELLKINSNNSFILNAQASVESFYRSLGFETCGDYYLEANIKHIKMKKTSHLGGLF